MVSTHQASAERFFQTDNTWYTKIADATECLDSSGAVVACDDDPDSVAKVADTSCIYSATANYPFSGPQCTGNQSFIPAVTGDTATFYRAVGGESALPIIPWKCAVDASHTSCTTNYYSWQKEGWDDNIPFVTGATPSNNAKRLTAFPNSSSVGDGKMVIISADKSTAWDLGNALWFPNDYADTRLRGKFAVEYLRKWDLTGDGVTGITYPFDGKSMMTYAKVGSVHGTITHNEVLAGTIDHAIAFGYAGAQKEPHWTVYPSGAYTGGNISTTSACIPADGVYCRYRPYATTQTKPLLGGERLYLPATTNCDAVSNAVARMVCKAARDYGMIFMENTGNGHKSLYFENQYGKSWNWSSLFSTADFWDGETSNGKIPWHDLQVRLPMLPVSYDTDATPPTIPGNLTASAVSANQINLTWSASTDNVGVAGYRIYRNGTQIATTSETNYTNTGLSPLTTYRYAVEAFDDYGNVSAQSLAVSATTPASSDTQAPTVPSGLKATIVSSTQINLTWTASMDNVGVSGYKVYINGNLRATTMQPNYSDTGLTPSTTYTYAVSAFDGAGNTSPQSAAVSATTQAAPDTQAPTVPTGLTATVVSSSQINLAWAASTDNVAVTGYRIYRNGAQVATSMTTSYSNTGLVPSTAYSYSVAAFDAAGNASAKSAAVSATTQAAPDTQAPTVPTGLTATVVSSSQINLAWAASTDNVAVTGYRIYRNGAQVATSMTTSYSNTGLVPSTAYSYSVAAYDVAGNVSVQSAQVPASTMAEPIPDIPVKLKSPNGGEVLPTGTIYDIAWDGPSSAVTFDLSYSNDGGATWKPIVSGATGKNHSWQVPVMKRNKKNCLMKVIGYDASRSKIGDDISDASFVVEVTKLTSPNGGQNLKTTSSDAPEKTVVDIAWVTYETKNPVASVKLKYTVNGGRTWKLIDEVSGNPGAYSWELPGAKKLKDKCRVAVILKDADGKTVGVDGSDDYFTMEPES